MTYALLSEAVRVARKAHRCIWCGQSIAPGEKYRDERSVYYGNMQHFRWHPECVEAQQEEHKHTCDGEFEAYANDRPQPEVRP